MINNDFYETLKDQWYTADDHPIALLRAENAVRAPWVIEEIARRIGNKAHILDIGCGGGFLSNPMADAGYDVTGIDLSEASLAVAEENDASKNVKYLKADAYALPFEDNSFDVACAMDILEHVNNPEILIREAARVVRPGGLFFFHTFNRNWVSNLVIIKGVDWFVKNAPKNMHVYNLFIKPDELKSICLTHNLHVATMRGFEPKILQAALWKMLLTREVPKNFQFTFSNNLMTGYCGIAEKVSTCGV